MKVYQISNLGATTTGSGDLFTIAVNTLEVNGADSYALYVSRQADNTRILTNEIAGDNEGVEVLSPEFYPYATEGAECSAFVTDLAWADENLQEYEYIKTDNGSTKSGYIVFGVLNSTKTQFNDPFETGASLPFQKGACWNGDIVTNYRG